MIGHISGCVQPRTAWFDLDCRKVIDDSKKSVLAEQKFFGSFLNRFGIIDSDLASMTLFYRCYNTNHKNVGKAIELPILWSIIPQACNFTLTDFEHGGARK